MSPVFDEMQRYSNQENLTDPQIGFSRHVFNPFILCD